VFLAVFDSKFISSSFSVSIEFFSNINILTGLSSIFSILDKTHLFSHSSLFVKALNDEQLPYNAATHF
jgi:hypothetical protein